MLHTYNPRVNYEYQYPNPMKTQVIHNRATTSNTPYVPCGTLPTHATIPIHPTTSLTQQMTQNGQMDDPIKPIPNAPQNILPIIHECHIRCV